MATSLPIANSSRRRSIGRRDSPTTGRPANSGLTSPARSHSSGGYSSSPANTDFRRPPRCERSIFVIAGVDPYSWVRSTSWFETLDLMSRNASGFSGRFVRRKPSVNHCAKYAKSTVDFGHGVISPSRSNSAATCRAGGSVRTPPGAGGSWRALWDLSVSESHEV